jgi:hypothetical protein
LLVVMAELERDFPAQVQRHEGIGNTVKIGIRKGDAVPSSFTEDLSAT